MLTLSPINVNIQNTLKEKMGMLRKMSGEDKYIIGTSLTKSTGDTLKNYMFARTPFLRMTSFSPQNDIKEAIVLMGGQLKGGSTDLPMNRLRAGFADYAADVGSTITKSENDPFINYLGLYTQPDKTIIDDIPYRPTAGLKDISIEYRGGGMRLGATRTAEISWTCWTWQELENYRPHFLHHGKMILLEWGWSGDGILWEGNSPFYDVFQGNTLKIKESKIVNLNQKLLDHVLSQKGHYDAMLGLIQDFTWTVNEDGAFDCSTKLISQGITLFQKSQRRQAVQSMASLPLLAGETATAWGWVLGIDDTEITFKGKQTVESLAPYISIQEYMNDFPQQIHHFLKDVGWTNDLHFFGKEHQDRHGMRVLHVWKYRWKDVATSISENGEVKTTFGVGWDKWFGMSNPEGNDTDPNSTRYFCTWGWFEDNVLSRFFGTVGEIEGFGDELIGEFRSIEPTMNSDGLLVKMTQDVADAMGGEVGQQVYESTKMTNSRFLITIDPSKWIIPNPEDPFFLNMRLHPSQNLGEDSPVNLRGENMDLFFTKKSDESAGRIRNIYFNANYLREKFKDSTDIVSSVLNVWEDFSNQYGGIYKFKVEIADDGKRAMIVEEGYTVVSVEDTMTDPVKRSKVFEFPVWKTDSVVKSQTISAKVPKRMQLAAMYGAVSQKDGKEKEKEGTQTVSNKYDDLVAKAWGRYVEDLPSDTTGMSPDEIKKQRYKDMLVGNVDTPHRKNRYFGQAKADVNQKIFLGELPDDGPATFNIKGIKIYDSILNELQEVQKKELFAKMKGIADVDEEGGRMDVETQKALLINKEEVKIFMNISSLASDHSDASDQWQRFYNAVSNIPTLKKGFHSQLQMLLRGHTDGVLANINPLLPIDFELEVDGIAGIFPGNSFHSSYLPERYRDESIFQAVGVSHKIDSSGWFTTIKGQIRAKRLPKMTPEEKEQEVKEIKVDLAILDNQGISTYNKVATAAGNKVLEKLKESGGEEWAIEVGPEFMIEMAKDYSNHAIWSKNESIVKAIQTIIISDPLLQNVLEGHGGIDGKWGPTTATAMYNYLLHNPIEQGQGLTKSHFYSRAGQRLLKAFERMGADTSGGG